MTTHPVPSPRPGRRAPALYGAITLAAWLAACAATPPNTPPPPAPVASAQVVDQPGPPVSPLASAVASASIGVPARSAPAAASAAPLAPGQCPAAVTRAPESAFKDDDGVAGPAELPIEDLDGDGVPEIVVSFPASYTERGILVLKKVPAPACFQQLYLGVGDGAGGRKTKTKGLVDLSVVMTPITSNGRGLAMAIAKYDGKRYRLTSVEKCAGIDGKKLPAKECNAILAGYGDDAKGGAP